MPTVDLKSLSGVVNVRTKDGNKPGIELSAIEEGKLKNFTYSATDPEGRSVQLTTGMLRVLAKNRSRADELLSSSDFRGLLRDQATEDVSAAVDRNTSGSMAYPAGAFDHLTVSETLSIFPNVSDVHLVDIHYVDLHRLFHDHQFEEFTKVCGFKPEGRTIHRGQLGKGGEIVVAAGSKGRHVRFHFHSEDALKISREMVGEIAVAVVKYPGEGGGMESQPGFYEGLSAVTGEGGYVLVKWARKPTLPQLEPVFETDMSNPGSRQYVSADDWAVYRKKAQT